MYLLRVNEFIIPLIMILLGSWYKSHSKEYVEESSNGYSTPMSRSSKEAWDYAQRIFPAKFIRAGIVTLIIAFLLNVYDVLVGLLYRDKIIYVIEGVILCLVFIKIEHILKVNFKEEKQYHTK